MSERANGCAAKVRRDNIIQLRMPLATDETWPSTNIGDQCTGAQPHFTRTQDFAEYNNGSKPTYKKLTTNTRGGWAAD